MNQSANASTFPIDSFITILNRHIEQAGLPQKWMLKKEQGNPSSGFSLILKDAKAQPSASAFLHQDVRITVSPDRIVDMHLQYHRKQWQPFFYQSLEKLGFDCLLLHNQKGMPPLQGVTERAKKMEACVTPFLPYLPYIYGSNLSLIFAYQHVLPGLSLDFESGLCHLWMTPSRQLSFSSPEEAIQFIESLEQHTNVCKELEDSFARLLCRYDPAAFCLPDNDAYYVYQQEGYFQISFSYGEKQCRYEAELSLPANKKWQIKEENPHLVRKEVLHQMEKYLAQEKLRSLLSGRTGNFFFQLCVTEWFEYKQNYDEAFYGTLSLSEAKTYINQHFHTTELVFMEDLEFLQEQLFHQQEQFFGNDVFTNEINYVYKFGQYVILAGDYITLEPKLFMVEKDTFQQWTEHFQE